MQTYVLPAFSTLITHSATLASFPTILSPLELFVPFDVLFVLSVHLNIDDFVYHTIQDINERKHGTFVFLKLT